MTVFALRCDGHFLFFVFIFYFLYSFSFSPHGRFVFRGGLMVSALDSGSSGPGLSPGGGHCVVFFGKTRYSHNASLHPFRLYLFYPVCWLC